MLGTKYLSELVKPEMLQAGKLNIIKSPTGSGKSYFALTAIPQTLTDATHRLVYLIDTINGKEQILNNYHAQRDYMDWVNETSHHFLYFDKECEPVGESVVVITYAKFGKILEEHPNFHEYFDYIICDELPSLFKFEHYSEQPNSHTIAHKGIERAVQNGHTIVVALSATPDSIAKMFNAPCYTVPFDDTDLKHYETKEIIPYTNLSYLLTTLDGSETGICYVSRISDMIRLEEESRQEGLHPVSIWSIRNEAHPMTQEQMDVRNEILENFTLPSKYNFLIINASSETSIKIKSPIDYVIVHSKNEDTQIQVRGRVNSDLSRLYLPSNCPNALTVPNEFLSRPLFREDKEKLYTIINLRNDFGRIYRWRTISDMLIDCDYCISNGRKNNRRYSIITLPANMSA